MGNKKKINFIAGGTWNLPFISNIFSSVDINKKRIITSIPKKAYRKNNFKSIIIPKYFQVIEKLFKIKFSKNLTRIDDLQFSYLASKFINNGDVVWGLQGFLYDSLKKNYNGYNIVDRSCPHIIKQEKIKEKECEILQITYKKKPEWQIRRTIFEYQNSDCIIVPSELTRKSFIDYGIKSSKIIKLPIIDNQLETKPVKKKIGDKIVYGCLGGDITRKGIFYLLKAWQKLNPKNAILKIKITNYQIKQSRVLRELLGKINNIKVVGYYSNLDDFFNNIDVFVFPSSDDGFGMAINDAMRYQKFSVVSNNAGASEYVVSGKNGFRYDYDNIEELVSILEKICHNSNLLEEFSNNSYFENMNKDYKIANNFINQLKSSIKN